jgi:hypothetical protein
MAITSPSMLVQVSARSKQMRICVAASESVNSIQGPPDDLGAQLHCLPHQIAHETVLREGDDLDIDKSTKFVAGARWPGLQTMTRLRTDNNGDARQDLWRQRSSVASATTASGGVGWRSRSK